MHRHIRHRFAEPQQQWILAPGCQRSDVMAFEAARCIIVPIPEFDNGILGVMHI
jgi:hypothetical protein